MVIADMRRSVKFSHPTPIQNINSIKTTASRKQLRKHYKNLLIFFYLPWQLQSDTFVQNTIQKQDTETQTDQTLSVQEPKIFSICQESDIQVNLFGAEPLDWTPVSPIASITPLRSPSTDDVELDSALDEIELLKQELQDMNRMNESDRVFYEEKIADMEFSLNELSALTISTGDSLSASQIFEELKSSQIEQNITRKRFSVGDVV